jgi:hypothetical protein
MLKKKHEGKSLEIKTFTGDDGTRYLVIRTLEGSYYTFVEVQAKQAAVECGAHKKGNTRQMWESIWDS